MSEISAKKLLFTDTNIMILADANIYYLYWCTSRVRYRCYLCVSQCDTPVQQSVNSDTLTNKREHYLRIDFFEHS